MRYLNVCFLGLAAVLMLASCSSSDDSTKLGNWIKKADYAGDARYEAVAFVIGDTAYVGTGYGGPSKGARLSTFYKYDPNKDNWTVIASMQDPTDPFKNLGRTGASAFAVAGKGYVVTGCDSSFNSLNDTWAYDPTANSWSSKAAFPGVARYYAVGFAIGDSGYIGTGTTGSTGTILSDFYRYDPTNDKWDVITSLKDKRKNAVSFVINDSAYVVSGTGSSGSSAYYMYVYDRSKDEWREKSQIRNATDYSYDDDYTTLARTQAVAFTINNKAYLATGTLPNTWEYNPVTDRWEEKTAFDGTTRTGAVGFTVKGNGYVATGANNSTGLDDLRVFDPNAENDTNDN
ncbi:kelch repeat-containing protein [Chitinophaga sp.]|uniref:Kelch repeat-containing protein n=1 Tax=Chitinophaga sp. TaxID=1869181 RepID=UPI0031DD3C32